MMNFVLGKIPDNSDFDPASERWTAIKEPSPWLMQLIALPIAVLSVFLMWKGWYVFTPIHNLNLELGLSFLFWIIGTVVFHELIHAFFHPGYGVTPNTYLGFWPSTLLFYAHYHSILSKQRFMAISIGPFLFISVIPLLFCILFQYNSTIMCAISLLNTLFACGDIFAFILIYFAVPSSAVVQNKGWRTYYKTQI